MQLNQAMDTQTFPPLLDPQPSVFPLAKVKHLDGVSIVIEVAANQQEQGTMVVGIANQDDPDAAVVEIQFNDPPLPADWTPGGFGDVLAGGVTVPAVPSISFLTLQGLAALEGPMGEDSHWLLRLG